MQINLKKVMMTMFAMLAAQSAFAMKDMPSGCPTVAALAKVGVSKIAPASAGGWAAVEKRNSYDTNADWGFVISEINGSSTSDILIKANAAITDLVLTNSAREEANDKVRWKCIYEHVTDETIRGVAITPAEYMQIPEMVNMMQQTIKNQSTTKKVM